MLYKMEDMEPDGNMLLLIKLCIDGVYTYESSLLILECFNYSPEKYYYSKQILKFIYEDDEEKKEDDE
jgi:hypothetical protein